MPKPCASVATGPPGVGGLGGSDVDVDWWFSGSAWEPASEHMERMVTAMPVKDTSAPEPAAMMAAMPKRSTSEQLQERQDREARARAVALQREYADALAALAHTVGQIRARLDALSERERWGRDGL